MNPVIGYDKMNYEKLNDTELIELIRQEDDVAKDYLLNKYKNLVAIKARAFYLSGGDFEDVIQEGMIGLFKAINNYKSNKDTSFETFASLCISRQIYTAIKNANRKKHAPLNNSYSLNILENDEVEFYPNLVDSPESILIAKENTFFLEEQMENLLTELEKKVLRFYLKGLNYEEIGKKIDKNEKAVDNALQRIRKKLMNVL